MQKNIRRRKSPTYLQNIIEAALMAHDERMESGKIRFNHAVFYPTRLQPIPGISDPADIEAFNKENGTDIPLATLSPIYSPRLQQLEAEQQESD